VRCVYLSFVYMYSVCADDVCMLVCALQVIECYEDYTSKTCGQCGVLNQKLGGHKVFNCPEEGCDYIADRDISAARNILLRYLTRFCPVSARPAQ
jgi:transposase